MQEIEILKDVLVVGDNEYGNKLKDNLKNLGFPTHITNSSDLISLQGRVGNFEIKYRINGKVSKFNVGTIVIAENIKKDISKDEIKIESPDVIITQTKFEKILNLSGRTRREMLNIAGKTPDTVCFFLGEGSQLSKVETYNCLKNSLILREKVGCEVYVLCRDLKIAGNGMEEIYREARRAGVLFLKYINKPEIEVEDRIKIKLDDYYLTENERALNVEIMCDLMVVDELFVPDENLKDLGSILNIGVDSKNFLQCENINLYPVLTNRKGIFLLGSCHNPDLLDPEILREINIISEEIYNLLSKGKLTFEEKLKVNPEKCAICLTCIRSCPAVAIDLGYQKELDKTHAYIFNEACFSCGVCASLCPAGAIEFKDFDDKNIFELLEAK